MIHTFTPIAFSIFLKSGKCINTEVSPKFKISRSKFKGPGIRIKFQHDNYFLFSWNLSPGV
jgi:hypothetical protein